MLCRPLCLQALGTLPRALKVTSQKRWLIPSDIQIRLTQSPVQDRWPGAQPFSGWLEGQWLSQLLEGQALHILTVLTLCAFFFFYLKLFFFPYGDTAAVCGCWGHNFLATLEMSAVSWCSMYLWLKSCAMPFFCCPHCSVPQIWMGQNETGRVHCLKIQNLTASQS